MNKTNETAGPVFAAIASLTTAVALAFPMVLTANAAPPAGCPGMVSYWSFNDGSDPGKDDQDANDGTVYGATPTTGQVGGALGFDGIDDYVAVPDSSNLDITGDLTVEVWFYMREFGSPYKTIVSKLGASDFYFQLFTDHTNLKFAMYNGGWQYNNFFGSISLNQWYHAVAVRDQSAGTLTLYLNGGEVNQYTIPGWMVPNDQPVNIGRAGPHGQFFKGDIDEVAIYDSVLELPQIEEHYANGLDGQEYCAPPDDDGDGVLNDQDDCPETPSGEEVDEDGCAESQKDADGDGVTNDLDKCAGTPPEEDVLAIMGCGPSQVCGAYADDADEDGVVDDLDVCPGTDPETPPYLPIAQGCSCFQILQLKPGADTGEMKNGCSNGTLGNFLNRRSWASGIPLKTPGG
ncbi:MAG: LamG domain-containing protein [Elusimicrobiota bacterium]